MSQISTVVSRTFGTATSPIKGDWSFLTGVRLELTLTGYSVNLVGHLQGQETKGKKLDASSVKPTSSPFFGPR